MPKRTLLSQMYSLPERAENKEEKVSTKKPCWACVSLDISHEDIIKSMEKL